VYVASLAVQHLGGRDFSPGKGEAVFRRILERQLRGTASKRWAAPRIDTNKEAKLPRWITLAPMS
jgi:hypothetical protein